ncbi:hypothetical protein [Parvularcula maris]|uniref:XapX domain-containing protein n=1 Tax=Parvularcula maris TaxID=2965077 RepID=A0A9X2L888_9PROT|nr:hypothetical protein [Parvularcula maris]MCQ8184842.1 hypothetical protein [Parvularcula maris]
MSLGKIILYAMGLGILVGLIVSKVAPDLPASLIGMVVTIFATVAAGRLQPPPPRR